MSNNSRNRGNGYERDKVIELKKLNYDVVTSRNESRLMDARKVDIFSPLGVENILPFYIQCKNTTIKPDYHVILNEMPTDRIPIIFHKLTKKANTKFITQGEYVILKLEDFYKLIGEFKNGI
jgi:hypothetical protein